MVSMNIAQNVSFFLFCLPKQVNALNLAPLLPFYLHLKLLMASQGGICTK